MKEKVLYFITISFIKFMGFLPTKIRRGFFKAFSYFVFLIASRTNKIIKTNLDFVFDNKLNNDEVKEIQKYSYYNMTLWVQTMIEGLKFSNEYLKENVSVKNQEFIDNLIKENKKIIVISAHFGNMEMLSLYINKFITPLVQVARESNFKEIDKFVTEARQNSGSRIVYKDGALRYLVKALKKSEAVSLIIDQNINLNDGEEVEFLGKKASQTASPSILSRKFEAYIVPVAIFNKDNNKYEIKFYEPISPIITKNEKEDIKKSTQLQADAISKIILEDKKQWFWPHKRFKIFNREIYARK